jgi:cell pole-organizing protein PopZ
MEDILASIRRILSEEDAPAEVEPAPADDETSDVLVLDRSMLVADPPPGSHAGPPPPHNKPHEEDDIESASAPSLAETEPFDLSMAPEPPIAFVPPAIAPAEDATPHRDNPFPTSPAPDEPDVSGFSGEAREPPGTTPPDTTTQSESSSMSASLNSSDGLTSTETAAAAAGSLSNLVRALTSDRTMVHSGGPTVADLVREEIRPMLKAWLDANLPPLVERLVRAEIERVIARASV